MVATSELVVSDQTITYLGRQIDLPADVATAYSTLVSGRAINGAISQRLQEELMQQRVIGVAIGLIMADYNMTDTAVAGLLTTLAQSMGVGEGEAAQQLIDKRGEPPRKE